MKRFGFLLLVLAAVSGFATPSRAATIVALSPQFGPFTGVWDLLLTTSVGSSNNLGGALSINNALQFIPNTLVCDNVNVLCGSTTGAQARQLFLDNELPDPGPTILDNTFLNIAVATLGALDGGIPRLLGQIVGGPGGLPELTLDFLDDLSGVPGQGTAMSEPVTFINPIIPEPSTISLMALGLGGMALLRRRSA